MHNPDGKMNMSPEDASGQLPSRNFLPPCRPLLEASSPPSSDEAVAT
jgi:hypothetical protein